MKVNIKTKSNSKQKKVLAASKYPQQPEVLTASCTSGISLYAIATETGGVIPVASSCTPGINLNAVPWGTPAPKVKAFCTPGINLIVKMRPPSTIGMVKNLLIEVIVP